MQTRPDAAARSGIVLMAALLVLLALELTAVGVLYMGSQRVISARAHERALRARIAAENAALDLAASLADRGMAPGAAAEAASDWAAGGPFAIERRLTDSDAGWLIVHARARDPGGARAGASLLLQRPDPLRFLPLFAAPGHPDDTAGGGVAAGLTQLATDQRDGLLAELFAIGASTAADALGGIRAPGRSCSDGDAGGAGGAAAACEPLVEVVTVEHTHRITGDDGPAILIVNGSLELAAGARLTAAVVVAGALVVEGGAHLTGGVHAVPGASLTWHGAFEPDTSAVRELLRNAPALRRPARGARYWLPSF